MKTFANQNIKEAAKKIAKLRSTGKGNVKEHLFQNQFYMFVKLERHFKH